MKRLLICRHAKSSWKDMSLKDIHRPLNKRGKRDAPEMGTRLAARDMKPDMIVASPARRALKTARKLAGQIGVSKKKITVCPELYGATVDEVLAIIRGFDDGVDMVLMVGHNPETTVLANILGDFEIDNVPTCGVVAFAFAVDSWHEVRKKKGRFVFFEFPRRRGK